MIIIHAFINVQQEQRTQFLELAEQVVPASQAEEGNISYYFYEDTAQPGNFIFVESWKDQAAIEYHQQTAHFQQFIGAIQAILREPLQVDLYEAAQIS